MELGIRPVHDLFGVEVTNLDLRDLDDATFEAVRQAIHKNGFGLLRRQSLDADAIVRLARRLGDPIPGYRPEFTHPDYPELVRLGNVRENGEVVTYLNTQGVEWHSDGTGAILPPNVTILYAVEAPTQGGDTLFSTATAAYQSLSADWKERLDGLKVVNSFDHHNDRVATFDGTNVIPRDDKLRKRNLDKVEPLVDIHPETGEPHLFVTHQMVKEVVGMDNDAGMKLVMDLVDHATQPQFVYRHHWLPGDLIIFDNRATMHSATPYDYPDERRLMYQIIIGTHSHQSP